jgi:hypothetical protein
VLNVNGKEDPAGSVSEGNAPESETTTCGAASSLVYVTVVLEFTMIIAGLNAKFFITTVDGESPVAGAGAANVARGGWRLERRSACNSEGTILHRVIRFLVREPARPSDPPSPGQVLPASLLRQNGRHLQNGPPWHGERRYSTCPVLFP